MLKHKHLLYLGLATILIGLHGCASVSVKRGYTYYQDRPQKLPIKVGLFLSDNVRNHAIPGQVGNKVLMGEALESEAVASLGKVFLSVILFSNKSKIPQDIGRIIAIEFGSETKIKFAVMKEVSSETELVYKVYDEEWNLLWEGTSRGHAAEILPKPSLFGFGGAYGGYQAAEIGQQRMISAVRNSLVLALEQINDQILTSGKDPILRK